MANVTTVSTKGDKYTHDAVVQGDVVCVDRDALTNGCFWAHSCADEHGHSQSVARGACILGAIFWLSPMAATITHFGDLVKTVPSDCASGGSVL